MMNKDELKIIFASEVRGWTVPEFHAWLFRFAVENFKGDMGLALLELELEGLL